MIDGLLGALRSGKPGGVGVTDWSVFVQEGRRLSLGIKDREIGNPHAPLRLSESSGASYRVIWSDGLISRGYLERRQLEDDLEEALRFARAAAYPDPDAAWVLGPAPIPEVETYDEATAALAAGDTGMLARRLEIVRGKIDDADVRTWSGSFSAAAGGVRLVTSAGLDVSSSSTSAGWHVTLNGEIGDGFGARKPETDADFVARLDRLIDTAAQLQVRAAPMQGGVHPVLLDPGVVEEYVLDTLLHNLGGSTVAHGEGHFRREQFGSGRPAVREDLTLRLDPLEPLKRGSYRFTSEGVPAAPCVYVEGGRLLRPMCDLKYARRLGVEPTPLPLGLDTLYFEGPEPLSLEEAIEQAAGGALILSVLGVHTQDSASGDFSLSAPQALRIDSDGFAGLLRATISGNLFRILESDDLRFVRFEGEHTPGLLFSCRLDPK